MYVFGTAVGGAATSGAGAGRGHYPAGGLPDQPGTSPGREPATGALPRGVVAAAAGGRVRPAYSLQFVHFNHLTYSHLDQLDQPHLYASGRTSAMRRVPTPGPFCPLKRRVGSDLAGG